MTKPNQNLIDAMREIRREVRTRDYTRKKKAFMRGSCWVSPTLPLVEGRINMTLYGPLRPPQEDGVILLTIDKAN